jgi:hypothetical protein
MQLPGVDAAASPSYAARDAEVLLRWRQMVRPPDAPPGVDLDSLSEAQLGRLDAGLVRLESTRDRRASHHAESSLTVLRRRLNHNDLVLMVFFTERRPDTLARSPSGPHSNQRASGSRPLAMQPRHIRVPLQPQRLVPLRPVPLPLLRELPLTIPCPPSTLRPTMALSTPRRQPIRHTKVRPELRSQLRDPAVPTRLH